MTAELTVRAADGRTLRAYDSGGDGPAVVWHHGTPHTGVPLPPSAALGIAAVTPQRPGARTPP